MSRLARNALFFVVGLLLGGLATLAAAADGTDAGLPGTQVLKPTWAVTGGSGGHASASAACASKNGYSGANQYNYCLFNSGGVSSEFATYSCVSGYTGVTSGTHAGQTATSSNPLCIKANSCPIGSTLSNGKCTCNSGLVFYDGMCKAPVCTGTQDTGLKFWDLGTSPSGNPALVRCLNGCIAVFSGDNGSATALKNGVRHYFAKGSYTQMGNGSADRCNGGPDGGSSSNPNTPSTSDGSATKPGDTCPPGHGTVKIDGVTNCVNASNGSTTAPPPETERKTTTTNTQANPDGSTTVTKTTTNNHTGGTTTVTDTYGPGVTPGTGQPSESVTVSTGGGAGVGSGTGNGTGNGDGDKDACEDDPERVGCKHWDEITGEVPDAAEAGQETQNLAFNPVSGFGSGAYSCPQSETFNVWGHTVQAFNYVPVCDFATMIRPVLIAFAMLGAALIGIGGSND